MKFWLISLLTLCLMSLSLSNNVLATTTTGHSVADAPILGYIQIPAGGRPGSSSYQRPTFSELGISQDKLRRFSFQQTWHDLNFYTYYLYDQPRGSDVIRQKLISHNVKIAAGTPIHTQTELDLYRLGIRQLWHVYKSDFIFFPELEFDVWDFDYHFTTPIARSDRHFRQVSVRVGFGGLIKLSQHLAVCADIAASIPKLWHLQIFTVSFKLLYTLLQNQQVKIVLVLGNNYQRTDFEDSQTFPNHIHFTLWPLGFVGILISATE